MLQRKWCLVFPLSDNCEVRFIDQVIRQLTYATSSYRRIRLATYPSIFLAVVKPVKPMNKQGPNILADLFPGFAIIVLELVRLQSPDSHNTNKVFMYCIAKAQ